MHCIHRCEHEHGRHAFGPFGPPIWCGAFWTLTSPNHTDRRHRATLPSGEVKKFCRRLRRLATSAAGHAFAGRLCLTKWRQSARDAANGLPCPRSLPLKGDSSPCLASSSGMYALRPKGPGHVQARIIPGRGRCGTFLQVIPELASHLMVVACLDELLNVV